MTAPHWNGNQQLVLNAIRQGVSNAKAIATLVGIDYTATQNAIRRLMDAGAIKRTGRGGYAAVNHEAPLLSKVWG